MPNNSYATFGREAFLAALKLSGRCVSSRMDTVRLGFAHNSAEIVTTDYSMSVRIRMPANTPHEFSVLLPCMALARIVAAMGGEEITIARRSSGVWIGDGEIAADLNSFAEEGWSEPVFDSADLIAEIDSEPLEEALRQVAPACSDDDADVSSGVHFAVSKDGAIEVVATDRKRFAVMCRKPVVARSSCSFTMPQRNARILATAASSFKASGKCRIGHRAHFNAGHVFDFGDISVLTSEFNASFPKYAALMSVLESASAKIESARFRDFISLLFCGACAMADTLEMEGCEVGLAWTARFEAIGTIKGVLPADINGMMPAQKYVFSINAFRKIADGMTAPTIQFGPGMMPVKFIEGDAVAVLAQRVG